MGGVEGRMSIYEYNGELHEGALDYDIEKMIRNDVTNELNRVGIEQKDAIASIRRILEEIEQSR